MNFADKMLKMRFRTRVRIFLALACAASVALLFSCRAGEERRSFSEVKGFGPPSLKDEIEFPADYGRKPGPSGGQSQTGAAGKLKWVLPRGWEAHVGSGMYYAIVKTSAGPDAGEIGVLALPGEAGGLEANAERWLGQLGIRSPAAGLEGFLSGRKQITTRGGLDLTLLDYGALVGDAAATSMLVAITKPGDDSYFIKWTGKKGDLAKGKQDFLAFVSSLEFE